MRKLFVLLFLSFISLALYAQKDTVFFLYRGNMYSPHDTILNAKIQKIISPNGNVSFDIAGSDGTLHSLMHSVVLNKKTFFPLKSLLLKKRVYYLNDLIRFDEKGFLKEFGYVGFSYSRTTFYVVPLLDMDVYEGPAFEVSFYSSFLLEKE